MLNNLDNSDESCQLSLEREINKFKKSWYELLNIASSILNKYLQTEILPLKSRQSMQILDQGFLTSTNYENDFFGWIISRHRDEIVNLNEFKKCSNDMTGHEILSKYKDDFETILLFFISEYMSKYNNNENLNLAEGIYIKYINALFSPINEFIILCPLFNFESEVEKLSIDNGLIIRRLREEEQNDLLNSLKPFYEDVYYHIRDIKFVIEFQTIRARLHLPIQSVSDDPLIDAAILSLRLLKKGAIWGAINFSMDSLPWKTDKITSSRRKYPGPIPHGDKYILKADEISQLEKLYLISKKVLRSDFLNKYRHISTAIKWFNKSYNEEDHENRFIWSIFLVEALCSEIGDTKHKISNRIAMCVGKDGADKIRIRNEFEKIYVNPRNIVHGSYKDIDIETVFKLEDYSRKLLRNFISISINNYDRKQALQLINDAYLSEKEKIILNELGDIDKTCDKLKLSTSQKSVEYNILFVIMEEIKYIKNILETFKGYQNKSEFDRKLVPNITYELIKLHNLDKNISEDLWKKIKEFHEKFTDYSILLNDAISYTREIIQNKIRKIKTEKKWEEWKQRTLAKLRMRNKNIKDIQFVSYPLEEFLKRRSCPIELLPQLSENQYLRFDPFNLGWDMVLSEEDLNHVNISLDILLKNIYDQINKYDLIKKIKKNNYEMKQLSSNLIIEIEKIVGKIDEEGIDHVVIFR